VAQADEERRGALERDVVGKSRTLVKDGALTFAVRLIVATARK
jgi:hypothetical protein